MKPHPWQADTQASAPEHALPEVDSARGFRISPAPAATPVNDDAADTPRPRILESRRRRWARLSHRR